MVQLVAVPQFHQAAQVHNPDAVGNVFHRPQVVGDKQVGDPGILLDFLQQVDDLGLDGDVQSRDGLVADDEFRIQGQGAGDADPLALAAGEFMGVPPDVVRLEAHRFEQLADLFIPLLGGAVKAVDLHGFPNDLPHRHAGVQGGVGVLEDHLHIPAEVLQLLALQ